MAKAKISTVQGETFSAVVTWTLSGVAVDLTGYTAAFVVENGNVPVVTTCAITNAVGGVITIGISSANTAANSGTAKYALRVTSGGGVTTVLAYGDFVFDEAP